MYYCSGLETTTVIVYIFVQTQFLFFFFLAPKCFLEHSQLALWTQRTQDENHDAALVAFAYMKDIIHINYETRIKVVKWWLCVYTT